MNYQCRFWTFQRSKPIHGPFCVSVAMTDKLLMLILDLFGSRDQVINKPIIPILTCQWPGSKYIQKHITTSFRPFCVPNITINKLLIPLSEFLKAT